MRSPLTAASSLAVLLMTPLYAYDQASALVDAERQAKAQISSLTDSKSTQSAVLWSLLGTIHQGQSRLTDAEQDYRHALAIQRAISPPDKEQEASILNNIATLMQVRRDFTGAGLILEASLATLKDNHLLNSQSAGPLLANLALNLQQQGKIAEAESKYSEAETAFENAQTNGTAQFALFLSNFGLLNFETGHLAEGVSRQRRALEVLAKLPSADKQQRSYVLNNLALGLAEMGQLGEARADFLSAIELQRDGSHALTYNLVETTNNLSALELKLGRYADARAHQTQAEQIAQQNIPQDDIIWATIWNNLGLVAISQKDYRGARRLFNDATSRWLRTTGPASPQYSGTLSDMASLESLCGHHKQSQQIVARVLEIDSAFFGPTHPRIATDLSNLATELFYRNKVEEAVQLLFRAKAIQEKSQSQNTLSFARTLDNLAAAHQRLKRFADSKVFYEQAIHTYELQQATSLPPYVTCLHQYAGLLWQMKDFANAELVEARANGIDVQSVLSGQSKMPVPLAGFR